MQDRLKALEKYNEYHQVVHKIHHMSDLHLDSSFYKQSMDINNYFKIKKWYDSSIGQSMVIQQLDKKRPTLSNSTKHKIGEDMLTLKMVHISFVALTSIVQSQLFVLPSE